MAVTQLGYVGVSVSDLTAWENFATEVLGLEIAERGTDGTLYLRMDEYQYRIAVHPTGRDDLEYVGWEIKNAETFEQIVAKLQGTGVSVAKPSQEEKKQRQVLDLVRLEDPNGISMEIFYGPHLNPAPFHPSRSISGFKTGPLGLGHVVFNTKDLSQSVSFYQELLGFRMSDTVQFNLPELGEVKVVFFHCNPRHHSLAFGNLPGPKKLSHIMLELNALDDVGYAFDLCHDKGLTITHSLGRPQQRLHVFFLRAVSFRFRHRIWLGRPRGR